MTQFAIKSDMELLAEAWIRLGRLERRFKQRERAESSKRKTGCRRTQGADEALEKSVGVGLPNGLPAQPSGDV